VSQAQLFFAFDYVALGAACIQLDGQIVYANAILADMLGFTREQLLQQRFQNLICPEDLSTSLAPFERLMAGEISHYTIEVRYRHYAGHWVWVKLSVSLIPAFTPHDQPLLLGQMSDITARKQQEYKLFLEQQRLRQAEAMARLGSWEMELVMGDCWWSEEFYRLCDYPPETLPSFDAYMARIHPEDQEQMGEAVRHAILKAQPFSLEIRLLLPDNQMRWVIARGAVEVHAHLPSRLRGHLFDISDLKQQMNQKHQQEQVLASFYRSAPFMMGIVGLCADGDLLHLYDNPQTAAFFGTTPEFLAGKKASVLQTPPDILARWWQLYQRSGELGLPLRMEYAHPLPDREAWLQVTVTPINAQEQLYCYIAEDITEHKQNYERLKASQSRFSSIFNTMYTLMGMLSPQGELLEVNQIALGIIQQPAEAVLGQLLWQTPWFQG
jgi:PAS domain S-box-containing protein